MTEDELKAAIEQLLLDYNTPTHPSWSLRDYLLDFSASLLAAQRERCAQIAEGFTRAPMDYRDWSPGPAADDRARTIAAAIRATPPAQEDA